MEKTSQNHIKRHIFMLVLLSFIILIGGCSGKSEIEELAFVLAIGIDAGDEPGKYIATYQNAVPKTSGGSGTEMDNWTISCEVSNLSEIAETVSQVTTKTPFSGSVRTIIIGEDLAREGINEVLDRFQRFYQYRRTIYLVLAKGKAKDILETQLRTDILPALKINGIIKGRQVFSNFPVTRIGHYLTVLGRENQNPVIPIVKSTDEASKKIEYQKEKGEEIIIEGCGVFEGGKLIDILTDEETRGLMWLEDDVDRRDISATLDGIEVVPTIRKATTKFEIVWDNQGKRGILFKIKARATLNEIMGQQEIYSSKEWTKYTKQLEPIVAQAIEKECRAAVEKNRKLKTDFIGIGRKLEQKDPKYWKEVRTVWLKQIPDFPVNYDIEVIIENTGLPRNSAIIPKPSR